MSSFRPSKLSITLVEHLDWPALQDTAILTPNSLWPQDVTPDDALSVSRFTPNLTPNSISGKFAWPRSPSRTPSSSHTSNFPLSARSAASTFPPEPPRHQTPLERHKTRLRRYQAAESGLVRLPAPPLPSPRQQQADALRYAVSHVTAHAADARKYLRGILASGGRDPARWKAEHRVAALESLQAELAALSVSQVCKSEESSARKREANLVRFLGARRADGLVPVFTRPRGRQRPPARALGEPLRRLMEAASPMRLQVGGVNLPASRHEWPWESRVRSVLLYPPAPKLRPPPLRLRTKTPTSGTLTVSTPTSGSFSPVEPDTPLTEVEDEREDDDDYFKSRLSGADGPPWQSRRAAPTLRIPAPPPRAPPSRPMPHTPLEDDEEDEDAYALEGFPTFRTDAFTSRSRPTSAAASDDSDDDDGYADNYDDFEDYPVFPTNSSRSLPPAPAPPRLPPLHTDLPLDASYAWLADSATWAAPPSAGWHGDGWEVAAGATPTSASVSTSPFATRAPTSASGPPSAGPRTPARRTLPAPPAAAPSPVHRFWSRGAQTPTALQPIAEAAKPKPPPKPKVRPLPTLPPPTPEKDNKERRTRGFLAGLVRRPPAADRAAARPVSELARPVSSASASVRSLPSIAATHMRTGSGGAGVRE
ncbi:hypothetical protein B0H15DRAFT_851800 [Mycena belliarum]|uniref:Uncharacterized protein n=1 Tax=Mycena belliarum TaxID=1033014 RepID=A0AAD6TXE1_9AGAR|nr:hypothetical protein B0H15DRAFT_851800 [Mycena belliae]